MHGQFSRTRKVKSMLVVIGVLATAVERHAVAGEDRGRGRENLGPGCDPNRTAIAHHAGGVAAQRRDEDRRGDDRTRPIPCVTSTGLRTGEPSIVVTNAGTVLFQPNLATPTGAVALVRSVDRGCQRRAHRVGGPSCPQARA